MISARRASENVVYTAPDIQISIVLPNGTVRPHSLPPTVLERGRLPRAEGETPHVAGIRRAGRQRFMRASR